MRCIPLSTLATRLTSSAGMDFNAQLDGLDSGDKAGEFEFFGVGFDTQVDSLDPITDLLNQTDIEFSRTMPQTKLNNLGWWEEHEPDEIDRIELGAIRKAKSFQFGSQVLSSNEEIPSLKDQEERARLRMKNEEVADWRSQAGEDDSDGGDSDGDLGQFGIRGGRRSRQLNQWTSSNDPAEGEEIAPVSDSESLHENKLQEGQTYYNVTADKISETDKTIALQPRHWSDAPSYPFAVATVAQPPTANDAIRKFKEQADNFSILSRTPTWGSRRGSEPDVADLESVNNGSFLTRLSISKSEERDRGHGSTTFFKDPLHRFADYVRNKGDGGFKRSRSSQPDSHYLNSPNDSYQSSSRYSIKSLVKRATNRGEFSRGNSTAGLVGLWKNLGSQPVPTLTKQMGNLTPDQTPPTLLKEELIAAQGLHGAEIDEDDNDEITENDEKINPDHSTIQITPTLAGFQEHVSTPQSQYGDNFSCGSNCPSAATSL